MRPLASSGRRTIRRTRALDDTKPRGCSSPSVSAHTAFTAALVMLCAGVDAAGASGASGSSDIQASLGAAVEDCKSCTMMQAIASPWCSHRTPPMLMSRAAFGCCQSRRASRPSSILRVCTRRQIVVLTCSPCSTSAGARASACEPRALVLGRTDRLAWSPCRQNHRVSRAEGANRCRLARERRHGSRCVLARVDSDTYRCTSSTRDLPSTWTTFCANSPTVPDARLGCSPSSTGACGIFRGIGLVPSARLAAS